MINETVSKDAMFTITESYVNRNSVIGASTQMGFDGQSTSRIVHGHAYAVRKVRGCVWDFIAHLDARMIDFDAPW